MDSEPVFRGEPLLEILAFVQARLAGGAVAVAFWVIDPIADAAAWRTS